MIASARSTESVVTRVGLPPFIVLASLALVVVSLYFARAVLMPVAMALLLAFLLSPVVNTLERLNLSRVPAVIMVVILTFTILGGLLWVITYQVTTLAQEIPNYESNIKQKISDLRAMTKGGTIEKVQKTVDDIKQEIKKSDGLAERKEAPREILVEKDESPGLGFLPATAGSFLEQIASAGLAIVLVIFMLIEREDMRNRLIRLVGYGHLIFTTRAMEDAARRISRYLLMQTIINASYGLAVAVGLYLIGLPYAALWGLLAAVLRFIPYVGPWVAAVVPSVLALAVFQGWLWPLVVAGLFILLELFANMIMEPLLYGESAGVSQVAILVAVAFWTWLWGPLGLVMATPLTVCLVVLGKYVPQLEFINVLMSDQPVVESKVIYYQRLLAEDRVEAEAIVTEYLKSHPVEKVYDELIVPALALAKTDYERGNISEAEEQFIFQATRQVVEKLAADQAARKLAATAENNEGKPDSIMRKTISILAAPASDEADETALLMLRQLLNPTRCQMHLLGDDTLASEVVDAAGENGARIICIGAVGTGSSAQIRYLCKRLRMRYPDLKILAGAWGSNAIREELTKSVVAAGADQVGMTLIQTRDQLNNLSRLIDTSIVTAS